MSIELYNFSQSTCSIKVRLLLEEKELPWVDKCLISSENHHLSEWYLKLNPNGVVPTLVDDEKAIFESTAILEYLEDKYTQYTFRPKDPFLCSQLRAWLIFVDVWPAPAVRVPSFQYGGLREKFKIMSHDAFETLKSKRPLKIEFYNSFDKDTGFPKSEIYNSFSVLERSFKRMELLLMRFGGPWLFGKEYTIGDMAVLPTVDRLEDLGFDALWRTDYPLIVDWLKNAQNRESSKVSFYHGSRLSHQFPKLVKGKGTNDHIVMEFKNSKN